MAAVSLALPVSQAKMLLALTIKVIGSESLPVQKIVGIRLYLLVGKWVTPMTPAVSARA